MACKNDMLEGTTEQNRGLNSYTLSPEAHSCFQADFIHIFYPYMPKQKRPIYHGQPEVSHKSWDQTIYSVMWGPLDF